MLKRRISLLQHRSCTNHAQAEKRRRKARERCISSTLTNPLALPFVASTIQSKSAAKSTKPSKRSSQGQSQGTSKEPSSSKTKKGTTRVREQNHSTLHWHQTGEFRKLISDFHDKEAHFPKRPNKEANEKREEIMGVIREYLQRNSLCSHMEFTGSSYEGIKVASSELEYDIMVILKDEKKCLQKEPLQPGYGKIKPSSINEMRACRWGEKLQLTRGYLSTSKIMRWFHGEMKKCVDKQLPKEKVKLRHHGPALQLDVKDKGKLWFSIDFVPAFKIGDEYYVAKRLKDDIQRRELHHMDELAWRQSFSIEEKKLMSNIDTENKCRRKCLRILKVIKDSDGPLRCMESYCIKTCFLHVNKKFPEDDDWDNDKLGERVVDVLKELASFAHKKDLPNFFQPKMNVFAGYKPKTLENIAYRIDKLLNSKVAMSKLLQINPSTIKPPTQ